MSKYCVIGSNAFSGQDFIDLLLEDPTREVIGVSRSAEAPAWKLRYRKRVDQSRYRFARFDLNREMDGLLALLDRERPDYIVNFAAQSEVAPSWVHPEHWFETNTVALARLINHLRGVDWLCRYLHISSPEAYGSCTGTVTEDNTPDNPSTPYAASKAAADMLIRSYQKQYGFPALFVRATNVYGARQQLFKIVPRTVISLKRGQKLQLHGGGVAVKSYIHVRDVSAGELAILHDGTIGDRYHLSPDGGIAIRDLVQLICARLGRAFEDCVEVVAERPGQDSVYVIDSTKARTAFGWKPRITISEGLGGVIDWVEENWPLLESCPLEYVHQA